MKKLLPIVLSMYSLSFALSSCSQSSEMHLNPTESDTLRYETLMYAKAITWTGQSEETDDTQKQNSKNDIPYRFNEQLSISFEPRSTSVYPELNGFGSLDTTELSPAIKKQTENFLQNLESGIVDSSYFDSDYRFAAVTAQYQLNLINDTFSQFMIGKPFIPQNTERPVFEIPVYAVMHKTGYRIRLFLNPDQAVKNTFLIQQISFEVLNRE